MATSDSEHSVTEKESQFDMVKMAESLKLVYDSIETAQNRSGAMNMQECRKFKKSRECLDKTIDIFAKGEITSFDKEVVDSMAFLNSAASLQQSRAMYTTEGSILILENLEQIEEWVKKHKSPKLKLKEAKERKRNK
jgi:hypothetical protein